MDRVRRVRGVQRLFATPPRQRRLTCVGNALAGVAGWFSGNFAMIVGLGTDIIETVRIGKVIERHGEAFLHRVFTDDEIRYCSKRREYLQHYAGRWAAKEAVMKVLGTGFAPGIGWKDIEVCTRPSGQPFIRLHGGVRELAERLGIDEVLISVSHCRAYATATAIGVRHEAQPPQ